jgi:hypothetical protein
MQQFHYILFVQSPHMLLTDALITHSRCAGDMQVRHEGGLHTGIAKLPYKLVPGSYTVIAAETSQDEQEGFKERNLGDEMIFFFMCGFVRSFW